MMICRPDSFWREHAHTDDERQYHDKHPGHITCASMHEGGGKTP
jgi:hypothetical protein